MCNIPHSNVFTCSAWQENTRPIRVCSMTPYHMQYDPLICMQQLVHVFDITHSNIFTCSAWQETIRTIHVCSMTYSYALHDSLVCMQQIVHIVWHTSFKYIHLQCMAAKRKAYPCVFNDIFICATWLTYIYATACTCVWNYSFICIHLTHSYYSFICIALGWKTRFWLK